MNKIEIDTLSMQHIDIVILCGGEGKRLRSITGDRPKSMAEIGGKPFLELLIDYFYNFGGKRFVLCTGYKSKFIEDYFQGRYCDRDIRIAKEDTPLDTGGAVLNALTLIQSDSFMLLNGDSFCRIIPSDLIESHLSKDALATVALTKVENVKRYGLVKLDREGRIIEFSEKSVSAGSGWINAGIYLMRKEVFSCFDKEQTIFSIEYDLLPKLIGKGLFGLKVNDPFFIDIGTPESFQKAQSLRWT